MEHAILGPVVRRAEDSKNDSDFAYFSDLLLAAEALAKLTTLSMLSAITDDKDRNRYRIEHKLVRSDGIGNWSWAVEDALTGPSPKR